jgi:hypothetical protein
VRLALLKAGVRMRDCQGRERYLEACLEDGEATSAKASAEVLVEPHAPPIG